ncbi:MAG: SDR family oxidoreductase [Hyphomicrobiales bacterium]
MSTQANPVVVVTGASAGVGRALARTFATHGYNLGLIARGRDGLEGARREAHELGVAAAICPLDVSDAAAVEEAAGYFERELGPIDIWVNNAMVSVFSPAREMKPEEYRRVTEVTYLGYVYGTLAALHRMLPRDSGTIVQVGSALAYRGIPLQSAYCGAKHAIQGFTESVRSELLHDGSHVRLKMVQLPAVNTPQFGWVKSRLPHQPQPVPPIFQPEPVAEGIFRAATHHRDETFLGWPTVEAIWANKAAPRILDRYLARAGFDSQQTGEPVSPDRQDNLWGPVPGDHGAHGAFDARARGADWQMTVTKHRGAIATGLATAAGLTGIAMLRARTGRDPHR